MGKGSKAFLVAEVGQAHDGSLGTAHAYIDAIAEAGADAVKFQLHVADAESSREETFRSRFSAQDATRYDYWKRISFTHAEWLGLLQHALDVELAFICSPFSKEAIDIFVDADVSAWKIGSGETVSRHLIEPILCTGRPVIISTGMSTLNEIDCLHGQLSDMRAKFAILQCTSEYPVAFANVGLNIMEDMQKRYKCPTGLSDHSGSIFPALAAIAKGADIVEVHVVFDKRMFGPDTSSSVTLSELKTIAEGSKAIHEMIHSSVDKNKMAIRLSDMRNMFTKSLAPSRSLKCGELITQNMLTQKKPGTGISPEHIKNVIGRRLIRDVAHDQLLHWEDLDAQKKENMCSC